MIENTVTQTTQSATVFLNNRPAINVFASIESDGKYNFSFNVTDSEAYFENEIEGAKDIVSLLTTVRKASKAQRAVLVANQPAPDTSEEPTDGEGE